MHSPAVVAVFIHHTPEGARKTNEHQERRKAIDGLFNHLLSDWVLEVLAIVLVDGFQGIESILACHTSCFGCSSKQLKNINSVFLVVALEWHVLHDVHLGLQGLYVLLQITSQSLATSDQLYRLSRSMS